MSMAVGSGAGRPPSRRRLSPLATASPPAALISSTTCWAGPTSAPVPSMAAAEVVDDDLGPVAGQPQGVLPADAPAGTGHDGHPALTQFVMRRRTDTSLLAPCVRPTSEPAVVLERLACAGRVGGGRAGRRGRSGRRRRRPLRWPAGRDVTVVDKAMFPRDKCCGDGLTTLALRELELLGFDPAVVADWQVVDGAVLRSPSGRQVRVPLPTGAGTYAAVAPRRQLDAALVDVARAAGATVLEGHGFDGTLAPARRPRHRRRRRHDRRRPATSSPPTGCGARCARRSGSVSPATSASGTPSGSTSAMSPGRPARPPPRVVRRRLPARLRLVVPAARRAGQRRLRRAARRHPPDPRT